MGRGEIFFLPPGKHREERRLVRFEIRYDCLGDSSVCEMGINPPAADKARHEGWASSHKLNETTRKQPIRLNVETRIEG